MIRIARWLVALAIAVLVGDLLRRVVPTTSVREINVLVSLGSHGIEAALVVLIVQARRGWVVGLVFATAHLLLVLVILVPMGVPLTGSVRGALGEWWRTMDTLNKLEMVALLPTGAFGGHLGGLLTKRVEQRRLTRRAVR